MKKENLVRTFWSVEPKVKKLIEKNYKKAGYKHEAEFVRSILVDYFTFNSLLK